MDPSEHLFADTLSVCWIHSLEALLPDAEVRENEVNARPCPHASQTRLHTPQGAAVEGHDGSTGAR